MTRIVITGDRWWTNRDIIRTALVEHEPDEIMTGGAPGADTLAVKEALALEIPVTIIKADWKRYGKSAGPKRNRQMVEMQPDLVLAFHDDIAISKGTRDCVIQALGMRLPVILYRSDGSTTTHPLHERVIYEGKRQ